MVINESTIGFTKEIREKNLSELPKNDPLIKVSYSSINFKDALSASGNKGVTRKFPHILGIDAVGTVAESNSKKFPIGSKVLVTGFDLEMNTWGGFGEYISIPEKWAVHLPAGLTEKEAMSYGTAGVTAGLSVCQILQSSTVNSENGKVVVSGATGGVGSIAVSILAKIGFDVLAVSGKKENEYLINSLGAKEVINRNDFIEMYDSKPLAKPTYVAGIDTVGGAILSGMLKSTQYGGIVTCCGMTGSTEVNTSIFPFILRGVHLAGIDSVEASLSVRNLIWGKLSNEWKLSNLEDISTEIGLEELPDKLDEILTGKAKGRYVLKH